MGYNELVDRPHPRHHLVAAIREERAMNRSGRIRLSTMEIVLIGTLLGSLALALWQARQEERAHEQRHDDDHH